MLFLTNLSDGRFYTTFVSSKIVFPFKKAAITAMKDSVKKNKKNKVTDEKHPVSWETGVFFYFFRNFFLSSSSFVAIRSVSPLRANEYWFISTFIKRAMRGNFFANRRYFSCSMWRESGGPWG